MYQYHKVFAAACITLLVFGIVLITLGSVLPFLTAKFTISDLSKGRLVSFLPGGILAGSLLFGPVVDRYGYKVLLAASILLTVIALEGLVLTNSFAMLQICIFTIGTAGGILNGGGNALAADISAEHKGASLSLAGVFFGIGALGMPLVLGALSKYFQYPAIVSGTGLFMLMAVIYIFSIRFPKPKQLQGFPLKAGIKLLKEPVLLLGSFFLFFQSGVEGLVNNWTTTFLQHRLGVSVEKALYALSFSLAGLTAARLLLGALLQRISSLLVLVISLFFISAGSIILMYTLSYAPALMALVLIGVGFAAGFPVIFGYIGQVYASLSGTAFSLALVIALTGNILINYFFGIITSRYSISMLPVFLLACSICMLIIATLVYKRIRSEAQNENKFTNP